MVVLRKFRDSDSSIDWRFRQRIPTTTRTNHNTHARRKTEFRAKHIKAAVPVISARGKRENIISRSGDNLFLVLLESTQKNKATTIMCLPRAKSIKDTFGNRREKNVL